MSAELIGSIISGNPEIALAGLATTLSQFIPNDELLQRSKDAVGQWGIGGNEFDLIAKDADSIISKSRESDMMF